MAAADRIAALLDATRALEAAGVAQALVGGVAVGVHSGVPRATVDIDLAVLSTASQQALSTLGGILADVAAHFNLGREEEAKPPGHASPTTTLEVYVHLFEDHAATGERRARSMTQQLADELRLGDAEGAPGD